jgi:hypothetical protein
LRVRGDVAAMDVTAGENAFRIRDESRDASTPR